MITTSESYNESILASARTNKFKATFGFIPPNIEENSTLSASEQAPQSQLAQVKDGITEAPNHWEDLSYNSWVLDGNANIPESIAEETGEYGFWSANQTNADAVFDNPPYVLYQLDTAYSLIGMRVAFKDFPTSFTMQYLDNNGNVIAEKTITEQAESHNVELTGDNVWAIKFIMNSWILPYRRAKLLEIGAGLLFTFDNSNTISFDYQEAITPFGNAFDSPQFEIEFDNSDRKFDMLNPSGLFSYLYKEMGITAELGVILPNESTEYVPMGKFYIYEIPTNQQRETATLVCRPLISLYDNLMYPTDDKAPSTISAVVAKIFEVAGSTETYTIDSTLADIECNGYCGEDVKLSDAFAMIATACGGYWLVGRDGTYQLKPIQTLIDAVTANANVDYDNVTEKPDITANRITSVKISRNYFETYSSSEGYQDWTTVIEVYTTEVDDGGSIQIACPFINTTQQAQVVAELALAYHNKFLEFSSKFRGNPALQVGDVVNLQTDYGNILSVVENLNVTYNNVDFLQSELKGRG